MANQAIIFGLAGAGGLMLVSAVTGTSLGDVVKGKAGHVQTTSLLKNGLVTGTGSTIASAANAASSSNSGGKVTAAQVAADPGSTAAAFRQLGPNQAAFAARLTADTGLDPRVIAAWMINEQGRYQMTAPNGANNWLNIGSTDSGFYGGNNPAWTDPITAADQTAQWLKGGPTVGYGTASGGIQSILASAGQSVQAQVAAIQSSGWASGGETAMLGIIQGL